MQKIIIPYEDDFIDEFERKAMEKRREERIDELVRTFSFVEKDPVTVFYCFSGGWENQFHDTYIEETKSVIFAVSHYLKTWKGMGELSLSCGELRLTIFGPMGLMGQTDRTRAEFLFRRWKYPEKNRREADSFYEQIRNSEKNFLENPQVLNLILENTVPIGKDFSQGFWKLFVKEMRTKGSGV